MEAEHVLANMRHLHSDVTQQTLDVLQKLQETAKIVVDAAAAINSGKTILHKQNETLLMNEVKKVTAAIESLKSIEGEMQKVALDQADQVLTPIVRELADKVKKLTEKDTYAMQFMKETHATQQMMAKNMRYAILAGGILVVLAFAAGYFLK